MPDPGAVSWVVKISCSQSPTLTPAPIAVVSIVVPFAVPLLYWTSTLVPSTRAVMKE